VTRVFSEFAVSSAPPLERALAKVADAVDTLQLSPAERAALAQHLAATAAALDRDHRPTREYTREELVALFR
jgi:hypothetical protein